MRAISMDLRQRIVAAVEQGTLSRAEIAEQFSVCQSWIRRLLQRRRETGSIEPLPHGGGRKPKLGAEHCEKLQQLIEQQSDATIAELRKRLGEPVSDMAVWRAVQRLEMPLKKNRNVPANKTGRMSSRSVSNIARPSSGWTQAGNFTSTRRRPRQP